ncbi:response regulator [bacterium CG_4_10_14_0_2_um_filter_33_32]|nr:MAG: hypothetical protein AUJ93_04360 [bacterium CG2_30_33_46]PIR67741.1 MAG: response regulator [bacterium CG10_big_fil_rev_8_21_14_0_10_33_18]PIU77196.1 MAG: response regulator [bacterium CG06_land_8_20_14_3_00_33_50]PIY85277.1 MAG: response regulator [bacterium CG_4_10_14_0_8_um_filter_33_57]PIZ86196.1 MAG: response regulator [bacterium CG_4_10_14_0_2_um_filter_33_32]PJA72560.1 MAG: response regulator [bacterium CG_4_9_14_3_um_filter_33_26]
MTKNPKKKILFADDEEGLREIYELRFKDEVFDSVFAKDGDEALEKIRKEKPDLVLLDIMMPGKNGMEVLEEIKKDPTTADIPVFMLTVLDDDDIRDKAFDLGAKYYLVKSSVVPPEVIKLMKEELYGEK